MPGGELNSRALLGNYLDKAMRSRRVEVPLVQHTSQTRPEYSSSRLSPDRCARKPELNAAASSRDLLWAVRRATRPVRPKRSHSNTQVTRAITAGQGCDLYRLYSESSAGRRRPPRRRGALPIHHYCSPCFSYVAERHRKARRSTRTRGLHAAAAPRCTPTGCASTPSSSTA